jgi:hypothetical protein
MDNEVYYLYFLILGVSDVHNLCVVLLFAGCQLLHPSKDSDTDVAGERRDSR